jgi:hypothetical protein
MAQWCRTNAGVETVTIEDPADRDALSDSIVEQTSSSGTVIQVALRGEPPARIAFNLPLSEGGVVDSLRRLLALASALCASALSRIRAQESVERDLASFRQLAIGSARGFLGSTTAAQHVSLMIPRRNWHREELRRPAHSRIGAACDGAIPHPQLRRDSRVVDRE